MSVKRVNISSGSSFEKKFGYSRAVKVGDTVYISGTVGFNYETGDISLDPVEQLRQIIRNIGFALDKAGAKLTDIVQTTVYITKPEIFNEAIGPELGIIFADTLPTCAALVVEFPVPKVVVELSATAVIGCGD